jgi:hypothetical protein
MLPRGLRLLKPLFLLALLLTTGLLVAAKGWKHVKMRSSWPHLTGTRNMNYDHQIVPASRIGPVGVGRSVADAVQYLGNPDDIELMEVSGEPNLIKYIYKDECIWFGWRDVGLDPVVESKSDGRGASVNVTCDKWKTASGLHVGSSPADVIPTVTRYCISHDEKSRDIEIETKDGILFWAKDRYSPINQIRVATTETSWSGCTND